MRSPTQPCFMQAVAALLLTSSMALAEDALRPNFVIIFTDDQGYADLGCYGAKGYQTPRIDRLAAEGTRFTSFYAQVVCGPSRSALLTGRYPVRSHGWSMPASEVTIAESLKEAGYRTGVIGKWDVSNRAAIADRVPNAQGFDEFWGALGANDNGKVRLYENTTELGVTDDMAGLTRRYTDKAIAFIEKHANEPFFLYLAHTMVHSVIDASEEFKGKSKGGLYGDTIEELDHHTGRLLDALDRLGLRDNTLVVFASDNGPWSNIKDHLRKRHKGQIASGESGPLRGAKGSTYEGGIRVPCIARWPGKVPAGSNSDALFATIDFLPTFCHLAGANAPKDRIIDGVNQSGLLLGKSDQGDRDNYFYFCRGEMHAYRKGNLKVVLPNRKEFYGYVKDRGGAAPELYDLANDLGEKHNLATARPEIVKQMIAEAQSLELPAERYFPGIHLPAKP